MTFPSVSLRFVRLDLWIRIRSVGFWPWLVFLAWALLARAQEPAMLRQFGIHVATSAIWSGAVVVLSALALATPPRSVPNIRQAVITSLVLVWGVGLVQAAIAMLLDLAFAGAAGAGSVLSAVRFCFAWLPAVFLLVVIPQRSGFAATASQAAAFLLCLCLAAPIWRSDLSVAGAISGLACTGSLLAAAGLTPRPETTESQRHR